MKKVGMLVVVAFVAVALSATAMAQVGTGSTDILGQGIFETEGGAFSMAGDTNSDQVKVGNDYANAFGWSHGPFKDPAFATNNLEIKKNQDTGPCACCPNECQDCCIKTNLETIQVGNRYALAFGPATAVNNVKIVTNQA
jgi:hypothetical protein